MPDRDRDPRGHHQHKRYAHNLDYDPPDAFEQPSVCRDSVDTDYNHVHDDARHVNVHCCAILLDLYTCNRKHFVESHVPVSDQ